MPRKYGTPFFSRYKYCFKYTAIVGIMESAYYDKAVIGQIAEKSRLSPEYIRVNAEYTLIKDDTALAVSSFWL